MLQPKQCSVAAEHREDLGTKPRVSWFPTLLWRGIWNREFRRLKCPWAPQTIFFIVTKVELRITSRITQRRYLRYWFLVYALLLRDRKALCSDWEKLAKYVDFAFIERLGELAKIGQVTKIERKENYSFSRAPDTVYQSLVRQKVQVGSTGKVSWSKT